MTTIEATLLISNILLIGFLLAGQMFDLFD